MSYTVGLGCCHSFDGLFNLVEGVATTRNKRVAELKHYILPFRILADGFHKLLINRCSLNYVDCAGGQLCHRLLCSLHTLDSYRLVAVLDKQARHKPTVRSGGINNEYLVHN